MRLHCCRRKQRTIFATLSISSCLMVIYRTNFGSLGLLSDLFALEYRPITWPFQPNEEIDFPSTDTIRPRIPHIIHQTYTTYNVPERYAPYIKTLTEKNPSWHYRFWTYNSARILIKKYYPHLLKTYDCFKSSVQSADMLRYVVLYHYGGVYADLDVADLRALESVTTKYACVIPTEPFEHAVLLYNTEFIFQMATMLCRQFHPFLKHVIKQIEHAPCKGLPNYNTGPAFITRQFINYYNITATNLRTNRNNSSSNSPYFYHGSLAENDNNAVYIPNTQYFSENMARKHARKLPASCTFLILQSLRIKAACYEFKRRERVRQNKKYTFLNHEWFKSYGTVNNRIFMAMKTVHICEIVPRCILYDD